ncbi:MAG: anti-sigma factor [Caldilineales bacterium]|nr:anti-sigma factor [Caldilineales bacterium]MDW8318171.1 anti-sigma factor [Anaerolineae bacterium]
MSDLQTATQREACDELRELLPAFGLGAADPDEATWVKSRLADCPEAAQELTAYAALAEVMLYSAPPVRPPAYLAERLRAALAQAQHRPEPAVDRPQRRWLASRLPALAALALAVLLLAGGLLAAQVAGLRSQQRELAAQVERQSALLAAVGEGTYLRVTLPAGPAGEAAGAEATVICDPERSVGVVYARNMPPLPAGQAYQVWLIRGEERTSAGLFHVSEEGRGLLTFQAPLPMRQYDSVGITMEPATGSPAPTTSAVVRGPLYGQEY